MPPKIEPCEENSATRSVSSHSLYCCKEKKKRRRIHETWGLYGEHQSQLHSDQILNFRWIPGKRYPSRSWVLCIFQAKDKEIFLCRDWHPAPNMNLCHWQWPICCSHLCQTGRGCVCQLRSPQLTSITRAPAHPFPLPHFLFLPRGMFYFTVKCLETMHQINNKWNVRMEQSWSSWLWLPSQSRQV